MKVCNNNQPYKLLAGVQLWNSGRQNWIFSRIGDQEGTILDPVLMADSVWTILFPLFPHF